MRRLAMVIGVLLLTGCNRGPEPAHFDSIAPSETASPVATAEPPTTVAATAMPTTTLIMPIVVPETLTEFELADITLDGEELKVAVADDRAERQQGLMGVEDLLCLDGMLFVFEQDSSGGFWMKNTLIPLDIAFFTADGEYVDGFTMEPCTADPCPTYRPNGSYRYALEMAAGDMPPDVTRLDL